MITIIVVTILGFYLALKLDSELLAVIFLVSSFLVMFWLPADVKTIRTKTDIISLKDNNSVEGHFCLGSGNVNGAMKFTFYTKKGSLMTLRQVDCEEAVVQYTKGDPYVEKLYQVETDSFWNWFAEDILTTKYILHVPEGSVQTMFNLDAE